LYRYTAVHAEVDPDDSTPTPTVLLLNPTGGSAAAWCLSGAVTHLQSRGYNVLLCDLRGQDLTGAPPPGPYSVRQLALDVAALLRSLGFPPVAPVHVIGYSLGAAVALQLAVLDATTFQTEATEAAEAAKDFPGAEGSRRGNALQRWLWGRFAGGGGEGSGGSGVGRWGGGSGGRGAALELGRPLVRSAVLFGFTSSYLAGKTPLQRLCSDALCSERFIRALVGRYKSNPVAP
jgi:pimeloyl-ACP methyl ester carboxylesterase